MSSTTNPARPRSKSHVTTGTPVVPGQGLALRTTRPNYIQTTQQPNMQPPRLPSSAISAPTLASLLYNGSPSSMSPNGSTLPISSSLQQSPDLFRDRDVEIFPPPPPLHLGDPIIAPRPSLNSIGPTTANGSNGAMADVMNPSSGGGVGLIRRFSNKFKARRQSAAAPNSRDVSLGPGILRRRSDSTNAAPPDAVIMTDSDEDVHEEVDEMAGGNDAPAREPSSGSSAPSVAGSCHDAPEGPMVPRALIKGTMLSKISKKRKYKRMLFTLESSAGKIVWDKGRSLKCLYIDDIKDIRIGSDTRQYRLDYGISDSEEGRFFTIFYASPNNSRSKQMHLIADDEETFTQWVTALDSISKHRELHMASLMAFNESAVRRFWSAEMAKHFDNKPHAIAEEKIDFLGVERVCRNLHIHMAQKDLKARFASAATTNPNQLDYTEFQAFIREMKKRKDVRPIYRSIALDLARGITWTEFSAFLRDVQGEDVDNNLEYWAMRFIRHALRNKPKETSIPWLLNLDSITMNEEAFAAYLVSKDNDHLQRAPVDHVLDRPVNEYFISSSHNTYLIGRQVADVSSVEGYIMTLLRGCRSVEVDCWDGSDGQPVVKHGRALTNAISFREVITTINKYAFVISRFPLWVSLEVHCNAAQQEIMAETMKEIFGPRLVTSPLDPSEDKLPSPSELKDRILIKVKGTHPTHQQRNGNEVNGRRRGNSLTSPFSKPVALDNGNIPAQYLASSPLLGPAQQSRRVIGKRVDTITEGEVHGAASSSTSDCDTEEESAKRKTSKIVKALGDLGVYCSGVKFQSFDSLDCRKWNHILSFMEGTFRKHSKAPESKKKLVRHNMRYMMRVYPQYSRLASDNFNPLMYWRKGVQMAALNWQTFDLGMQLNQAMFAGGPDQSGYVLKPESMRTIRILPGGLPDGADGKLERQNMTFSIDIISAQRLMRPASLPPNRVIDPYVEMEVFHANDKRDKHDSTNGMIIQTDTPGKFRTRVVKENGFDPEFNCIADCKVTTKYPELVFVKFSVKLSSDGDNISNRNPTVATYTVKLSNLKQGYRTLPLWDSNGDQFLFSTLFCRIRIQPATSIYIPNPEVVDSSVGKLKNMSKNVFNRSNTVSKNSFEKTSLDSGYAESPS
ncbi:phosphatidylinositol-specific phospholipase C [Poronia punctata]|nr:phosphatidylinositol-specific phospholipase C [Poronia punctata]